MRRLILALSAAVAVSSLASPASAQGRYYGEPAQARYYGEPGPYYSYNAAPVIGGVAAGTVAGVGFSQGWWGSSTAAASLGSSAAASAVAGGVVGLGAAGLIHAATTPCVGFHALMSPFRPGPSGCVNGEFVGYQAAERPMPRRRY